MLQIAPLPAPADHPEKQACRSCQQERTAWVLFHGVANFGVSLFRVEVPNVISGLFKPHTGLLSVLSHVAICMFICGLGELSGVLVQLV
ncbi:hypothetical protein [Desulfovibrio sp. DV]|uniref:hypothetical protein n=1 Tax=Desulfovibrio sp. DV TaxID=1844708 RepID=UPI0011150709|nr:hypothetical protein [Desulfovibrio sp. DV]